MWNFSKGRKGPEGLRQLLSKFYVGHIMGETYKKQKSYVIIRRSDEGLTLETSAFSIFHGGNSIFINSFDKTKFLK